MKPSTLQLRAASAAGSFNSSLTNATTLVSSDGSVDSGILTVVAITLPVIVLGIALSYCAVRRFSKLPVSTLVPSIAVTSTYRASPGYALGPITPTPTASVRDACLVRTQLTELQSESLSSQSDVPFLEETASPTGPPTPLWPPSPGLTPPTSLHFGEVSRVPSFYTSRFTDRSLRYSVNSEAASERDTTLDAPVRDSCPFNQFIGSPSSLL
ncbi:hypothetical protein ACHHYP_20341 [Achlya hypogyna]|uniref:Uncharacterized protein n=1 Tax=Achlya hypogyna TaxID=1202772 RepID=A0A1V9ZLC1_ACHHY|nr:hypothetical protein ACHHYP_20341 [Achlya hypogyna]